MTMTPDEVMNVIGQRGIDPQSKINGEDWELINRLDGNGAQLDKWIDDIPPTEPELTLARTPLIALTYELLPTGFVATATLTGGTTQIVQWRCVTAQGVESLAQSAAVNGVDTWEFDAPLGVYQMGAWSDGFGYAEIRIIF